MSECIIAFRNSAGSKIEFVMNAQGEPRIFENEDAAVTVGDNVLVAYSWRVIEIDADGWRIVASPHW